MRARICLHGGSDLFGIAITMASVINRGNDGHRRIVRRLVKRARGRSEDRSTGTAKGSGRATVKQSPGMDERPGLQYNGHWRMAVWALRVGYVGLAVAIAGLIVISLRSTPWVLAVGVFIWLAAEAVTLVGFFWSGRELPEPDPRTGR